MNYFLVRKFIWWIKLNLYEVICLKCGYFVLIWEVNGYLYFVCVDVFVCRLLLYFKVIVIDVVCFYI